MTILNLVTLFLALPVHPIATHVTIQDESGAALPDALVIVQSLDTRSQSIRYLSGKDGNTPTMELNPGLYRVIATFPYGTWKTVIREFTLPESADKIILRMPQDSREGYQVTVGATQLALRLESQDHRPLAGVPVLIRTEDAIREEWYVTDSKGEATVSVVADQLVAVVLYNHNPYSYELAPKCFPPDPPLADTALPCILLTDAPITLHLRESAPSR